MTYDEEILMAYADGELDAVQRAEIAAALDADPQLARRVEKHLALRVEVAGAFATVIDQPVPERLVNVANRRPASAAAPGGQVVQFPRRSTASASAPWRTREWMAMAASVLLGIAISWRFFSPADEALMGSADGALVARGELATALERQLASDQNRDGAVLIGLTFRAQDGAYCRSFTLRASSTAGLACRAAGEWRVPVTTATEIPAGSVQQAAGTIPPSVLSAIESRIAGAPLDADAEQAARLGGWQTTR